MDKEGDGFAMFYPLDPLGKRIFDPSDWRTGAGPRGTVGKAMHVFEKEELYMRHTSIARCLHRMLPVKELATFSYRMDAHPPPLFNTTVITDSLEEVTRLYADLK